MKLYFNKKKALVFSLVFIFFFLILSSIIPPLRSPLLDTLRFPLEVLRLTGREVRGIIFYHRNFIQNEQLKKELGIAAMKLNEAAEFSLENARLRGLLSLSQKSPYKVIAARVVGRPADNWSSVVIIDKGRHHLIRNGMVVINYQGLLGRIVEVGELASKVMLLNDPNFSVSSMVQRSRQEGLVVGGLGNNLFMRYLPADADIKTSDIIITSGLTELFPKGLVVGRVTDVRDDSLNLARYAIVEPALNLSGIDEVLIIVP